MLQELVAPGHTALIVIDLQNDFCSPEGVYSRLGKTLTRGDMVVKRTKDLLDQARRSRVLPIFVQQTTLPCGLSLSPAWSRFKMRSYNISDPGQIEHTIEGTWGWEIVDELKPLPGEVRIRKNRSSAFHNTNLDLVLRSNDIKTTVITGVATQGCVESTARDAAFHDYFVVVLEDSVDASSRELHDASMRVMASRFDIASSDEVLAIWRSQRTNPL
jgi:nicotinamidase-related amidase